jgi:hypothetical protein
MLCRNTKKNPRNKVQSKESIDSLKEPTAKALCAHVIANPDIINRAVLNNG